VIQIGPARSGNEISCYMNFLECLGSPCEVTTQLVHDLEVCKHLFQYDNDVRLCS